MNEMQADEMSAEAKKPIVNLTIEKRAKEPMSETFTFRTYPEEAKALKETAEKLKVTSSDLVRSALISTGVI